MSFPAFAVRKPSLHAVPTFHLGHVDGNDSYEWRRFEKGLRREVTERDRKLFHRQPRLGRIGNRKFRAFLQWDSKSGVIAVTLRGSARPKFDGLIPIPSGIAEQQFGIDTGLAGIHAIDLSPEDAAAPRRLIITGWDAGGDVRILTWTRAENWMTRIGAGSMKEILRLSGKSHITAAGVVGRFLYLFDLAAMRFRRFADHDDDGVFDFEDPGFRPRFASEEQRDEVLGTLVSFRELAPAQVYLSFGHRLAKVAVAPKSVTGKAPVALRSHEWRVVSSQSSKRPAVSTRIAVPRIVDAPRTQRTRLWVRSVLGSTIACEREIAEGKVSSISSVVTVRGGDPRPLDFLPGVALRVGERVRIVRYRRVKAGREESSFQRTAVGEWTVVRDGAHWPTLAVVTGTPFLGADSSRRVPGTPGNAAGIGALRLRGDGFPKSCRIRLIGVQDFIEIRSDQHSARSIEIEVPESFRHEPSLFVRLLSASGSPLSDLRWFCP